MHIDMLIILGILAVTILLAYRGNEIGARQKRVILAGVAVIIILALVTLVQAIV
jgi:hypothetical protein